MKPCLGLTGEAAKHKGTSRWNALNDCEESVTSICPGLTCVILSLSWPAVARPTLYAKDLETFDATTDLAVLSG